MKGTILFLILTFCSLQSSMAQTVVTGKVVDNATKEPMEFVNVVACSLPDTAFIKGVTTNAQGDFTLTELVWQMTDSKFLKNISYNGKE